VGWARLLIACLGSLRDYRNSLVSLDWRMTSVEVRTEAVKAWRGVP